MLLRLGFFACSWAECDVERSRPTIKRNVPELANLPMEGYFRALDAPLGGSQIWREKASLKSTKLYFSMFRDKPPCMPLCFGIVNYTARGGRGFYLFLSLYSSNSFLDSVAAAFSSTFSSCFSFSFNSHSFDFFFFL